MGDALNSLIIQAYKEKCDEAEYWKHLALKNDNKLSVVFHIRDRLQDALHDLTSTLYGESTHVFTPILRECKDWSEEDLQQITEMIEQWIEGDEHMGWKTGGSTGSSLTGGIEGDEHMGWKCNNDM